MPDRKNAFRPYHWAMDVPPMLRENGRVDREAHHVLVVLARWAKKDGSDARPSLTTLADRTYMTERATAAALDRIQAHGLISKMADLNGTTVWQLNLKVRKADSTLLDKRRDRARLANAKRQQKYRDKQRATPEESTAQAVDRAVDNSSVTPSGSVTSNAVGERHVTPSEGVTNAVRERYVTPSPPSHPQVTPLVTAIELPLNCQEELSAANHDAMFDAFWKAYPRRVSKAGARTKWEAAIKRGIDPAVILAAAERYATERAGADPRYTKHPTTWLNQGCWDDEPQQELGLLRVVGGWEPYRDPIDQSVYDERL